MKRFISLIIKILNSIEYLNKRKQRIDLDNMIIILSNLLCGSESHEKTHKEIF